MLPLIILSVILYEACLHLLFFLSRVHRQLHRIGRADLARLRALQAEVSARFAQDSIVIQVFVAAAPLLGLLGTVMGMVGTFDSLASHSGTGSSNGLAEGISMALITTETGLAIAIPATVLMYYAHRQFQRVVGSLLAFEDRATEAA